MRHQNQEKKICSFIAQMVTFPLVCAATLSSPWLVYSLGSAVTSIVERSLKKTFHNCITENTLHCGSQPTSADWFFAMIIQAIVASFEYCFWYEKLQPRASNFKPFPYVSALFHFSGLVPFFLSASFSAINTQHNKDYNSDALKWMKHYYIRIGFGLAAILPVITLCLLISRLRPFDRTCPQTYTLLQQTINQIKQTTNKCHNSCANKLRYPTTPESNIGHDVKTYLYALCCNGRAKFENPARKGEIKINYRAQISEKLPPHDRKEILIATRKRLNDLTTAENGSRNESENPQPHQRPATSLCQQLSTFFRYVTYAPAANVMPSIPTG